MTKAEPGAFDGLERAHDDEPIFTLLARDERAPALVRDWVARRGKNDAKAADALGIAAAMERWRARFVPPEPPVAQLLGPCGAKCSREPLVPPRSGPWRVLSTEEVFHEVLGGRPA